MQTSATGGGSLRPLTDVVEGEFGAIWAFAAGGEFEEWDVCEKGEAGGVPEGLGVGIANVEESGAMEEGDGGEERSDD